MLSYSIHEGVILLRQAEKQRWKKIEHVVVSMESVKKIVWELDVSKAVHPDGVSNWVVRECNEELAETVASMTECSLQEGEVPKVWRGANIVPSRWHHGLTTMREGRMLTKLKGQRQVCLSGAAE